MHLQVRTKKGIYYLVQLMSLNVTLKNHVTPDIQNSLSCKNVIILRIKALIVGVT